MPFSHLTRRSFLATSALGSLVSSWPSSAQDAASGSLADKIVALERRANRAQIPLLPDGIVRGGAVPSIAADDTYVDGMPRLVELIDRTEGSDQGLRAEAAGLLSELNADEREVPEQLLPDGTRGEPAPRFAAVKDEYQALFEDCEVREEFQPVVSWHIARLRKNKARYQQVSEVTHVPWHVVGIIHALEASFNPEGHLHNGDPLSARTVQVPKNRPEIWLPPSDWKSSAIDVLTLIKFVGLESWTMPETLYRFERYNGFGYRHRGINSPYLWSFSNHYAKGKFFADHKFSAEKVSKQCGAAVMMSVLQKSGFISL